MASPRLPLKRTRLDPESATAFMRQLKRAASGAHPELYSSFCDKLQAAVGAAEAANAASKPEEEGAATRRFLAEAEGLLAGLPYQGYYYALLRMLPEEQLPALNSAQDPERRAAAAGKADELCAESLVEAYDTERKAWSIAKVRQVQPDAIMLHYVGWPNTFDAWFHREEDKARLRPLSGQGSLGPYLQLGLTKAGASLKERVRIVLFTLGRGNFVHFSTITKHVLRPRLPRDKAANLTAQIAKILDDFQKTGLVAFQSLEKDAIAILRTPVLEGFGVGQEGEGGTYDFAPGDFVEVLTPANTWAVAQVNDVLETPWHQLKVHRIGAMLFQTLPTLGCFLVVLWPLPRFVWLSTRSKSAGVIRMTETVFAQARARRMTSGWTGMS